MTSERVDALTVSDALPVPMELVAETRKVYVVVLERPVTVEEVVVDVPSANVNQVEPLSAEYSIL